jgi:hypothetical protein
MKLLIGSRASLIRFVTDFAPPFVHENMFRRMANTFSSHCTSPNLRTQNSPPTLKLWRAFYALSITFPYYKHISKNINSTKPWRSRMVLEVGQRLCLFRSFINENTFGAFIYFIRYTDYEVFYCLAIKLRRFKS